jgi:tetratricopeptide (TPR) repeat protein
LALTGQWRYRFMTDKLSKTMEVAEQIYSLAQEDSRSALMIGACRTLAFTLYFLGDFQTALQHAMRGVRIWRSGDVQSPIEEINASAVSCLVFEGLSEWHLGQVASCKANIEEAIALARELNDMHGLAVALIFTAFLAHLEQDLSGVERLASDVIELSTRHGFALWLAGGGVFQGWARSVSGDTVGGISRIDEGVEALRATGSVRMVPYCLGLKGEALHLAGHTFKALEAIEEAEELVEESEERWWSAELHRLKAVFLAAVGADETQIEASFQEAIRIAKEQKSVSLEKRAEATYAEYRRQKACGSAGPGFRLPLW